MESFFRIEELADYAEQLAGMAQAFAAAYDGARGTSKTLDAGMLLFSNLMFEYSGKMQKLLEEAVKVGTNAETAD